MKKLLLILLLTTFLIDLVPAQDKLLGMTGAGGSENYGVIFTTNSDGTGYTLVNEFKNYSPGCYPTAPPSQAPNGKLYGTLRGGGEHGYGIIYEFDLATNSYTTKFHFSLATGNPIGNLVLLDNGNFIGVTTTGGLNGRGVLFEYNPYTNIYSKRIDFPYTNYRYWGEIGLTLVNGTIIYGISELGGSLNLGAIFEYDLTSNLYSVKFNFNTSSGYYPTTKLILGPNGKLYGTTRTGGGVGVNGVLFEYNLVNSSYFIRKAFITSEDSGTTPMSLILASNNKLYGVNQIGGMYSNGVLFEYDLSPSFPAPPNSPSPYQVLIHFNSQTTGALPTSLMLGQNGLIYGMTKEGGEQNKGVLFEFWPYCNILIMKWHFASSQIEYPISTLMQASSGRFYGVTQNGGTNNAGAFFEFNGYTNVFVKRMDFINPSLINGANPAGAIVKASTGLVYGVTRAGGANNLGGIFEYNPVTNSIANKFNFNSVSGHTPLYGLTLGPGDKLYGFNIYGGTNNAGVFFEFDPNSNLYVVKYNFQSGEMPGGNLLLANNNKLYFTMGAISYTNTGGVFEYDPAIDSVIKKFDFTPTTELNPTGNLIEGAAGKLYGVVSMGGVNNLGALFEYNYSTSSYTKKFDFSTISGYGLVFKLHKASNGKIYGFSAGGGAHSKGVLFEYNPSTNVFTKKIDLTILASKGVFTESSNAKLYALTQYGYDGPYSLYEYDLLTSAYTKKWDFTNSTGIPSIYNELLLIQNSGGGARIKTSYGKENVSYKVASEFEVQIHSNPFDQDLKVIVKSEVSEEVFFTLYNLSGVTVNEVISKTNMETVIKTAGAKGMYLLKVRTASNEKVIRVLKI